MANSPSKHLVLGIGEVGKAIAEVLEKAHEVIRVDRDWPEDVTCDVMHVCLPYKNQATFISTVEDALHKFSPKLTIIHSTVEVGTTDKLAATADVVHSPVRGVHPNLTKGVRIFVKYFAAGNSGGKTTGRLASKAASYFKECGVKTQVWPDAIDTELGKILSTTYYFWNIAFEKEAARIAEKYGASWARVYKKWNEDYNDGYETLGMPNVRRPVLKRMPGEVGGHCLVPNAGLLGGFLGRFLLLLNRLYKHLRL